MKFLAISKRRPLPGMTSAMAEATRDIAKRNVKNGVIMIRQLVWKVGIVMLLVFGLQLLCGLQVYAQQPDLGAAAAAKAAAREASSHGASNASDPVGTFITFDAPGAVDTFPSSINPAGAITGLIIDANFVFHGFLRARDGVFTTFDPPGSTFQQHQPGGHDHWRLH